MQPMNRSFRPPTRQSATRAILEEHHIYTEFPDEVRAAALTVPDRVHPEDLEGRVDLRDALTFTIDGDTAKDFDDAVSLTKNADGTVTLGVHIADVGHYVRQGSPIDREAFDRGTSVYFADSVAPMLPLELSNGICSLNPGVDRLTLSCIMTVGDEGQVIHYEILRSVIHSKERMTYHNCNLLLSGEADEALVRRYSHILPTLKGLAALDAKLQGVRRRRGALELETAERFILCDEKGRPVDIQQKGEGQSEGIIESMMLLANETVARHLVSNRLPGVFRTHEAPSQEKLTSLKTVLLPLGYAIKGSDQGSFQSLLRKAKGTPHENLVNLLVLRCMMKAGYAPENLGHYGLAANYYCHFTSPIRRYPDLVVNRILTATLTGTPGDRTLKRLENVCKKAAEQSTKREIDAMTAERDIEKLYLAEYMESHIGEQYVGTVSGVASFGLFLALPNGVEGLLPVRALPDDYYIYQEEHLRLIGERTRAVYSFGMDLPVCCVAANGGLGQVDFLLVDENGEVIPPRERTPAPIKKKQPEKKYESIIRKKQKKGRPHTPKGRKKGGRR